MTETPKRLGLVLALAGGIGFTVAQTAQIPVAPGVEPPALRVNRVFEPWDRRDTPGCAISIGQNGRLVLTRAYGRADLEFDIPITPETIFEAASVSKQFTAAAIALLTADGKLSLDDPVRKYLPEVPDFGGEPIRIRHFLNHTSGLRSQWPLLTLAGRPPGSAVHTVNEILDLVNRQKEVNFPPGEEFLYNNTGYTLLTVVVSRVSGMSFQQFCDTRLFKPIGMTRTRWREDHTEIVKGRATAYRQGADGRFHTQMSFTNVIGNGGLLTTVGDLFRWNENLDNPKVGGRQMVEQLQTPGRLNNGFVNGYAQGLIVGEYRGLQEISHGGLTAGYGAWLARFPTERFSIAVLCNVASADPETLGRRVVNVFLEGRMKDWVLAPAVPVPTEELQAKVGAYREPKTDDVLRLVFEKDRLRIRGAEGGELVPIGPNRFRSADGTTEYTFTPQTGGEGAGLAESRRGSEPRTLVGVPPYSPSAVELAAFAGSYYSDELGMTYGLWVQDGRLILWHRPETAVALVPAYADAFEFPQGVIRFTRDSGGKVDGFRIYAGRVRHLRFTRRAGTMP